MNKYKNLAKKFRKQVEKDFNKKCKDFSFGCVSCQAHRIIDELEELGNFTDDINKNSGKKKLSKEFLKSLARSEKDIKAGRVKELDSLKDLR